MVAREVKKILNQAKIVRVQRYVIRRYIYGLVFSALVLTGMADQLIAENQRASIKITKFDQFASSPLPGFIVLRYQKPDMFWQDYVLHLPVASIEQVTVEPESTILYLKRLKLSGFEDEGPVELVIPKRVGSSQKILALLQQVLEAQQKTI